jgi:hypothetical protein
MRARRGVEPTLRAPTRRFAMVEIAPADPAFAREAFSEPQLPYAPVDA